MNVFKTNVRGNFDSLDQKRQDVRSGDIIPWPLLNSPFPLMIEARNISQDQRLCHRERFLLLPWSLAWTRLCSLWPVRVRSRVMNALKELGNMLAMVSDARHLFGDKCCVRITGNSIIGVNSF